MAEGVSLFWLFSKNSFGSFGAVAAFKYKDFFPLRRGPSLSDHASSEWRPSGEITVPLKERFSLLSFSFCVIREVVREECFFALPYQSVL